MKGLITSKSSKAPAVPAYGLAGKFGGTRYLEGEGHDLCTVVHHPAHSKGTLVVGVERRAVCDLQFSSSDAPEPNDLARLSMATALVVDLPGVGDSVFKLAADVADDRNAWRPCEITVDGCVTAGSEGQHDGKWIAYCLTPELIIYVLADLAVRPHPVELQRCGVSVLARRSFHDLDSEAP